MPTYPEAGPAPWILAGLAVLPAVFAVSSLGRLHPDEVYQLLEPAYHRVHGYGVLAWEWQVGLRNWVFPGVAAGWLRVSTLLGIENPWVARAWLAIPQAALHVASVFAVQRWALRTLPRLQAWMAACLYASYGLVLLFAGRTLGESLSASFLVLGLTALDDTDEAGERELSRAGLRAGAWLGLAVVARYGSAVIVVVAIGWLLALRRWKTLGAVLLTGSAIALGLGAIDWATWGRPFHSMREYLQFNVFSNKAVQSFGSAPALFYVKPLLLSFPLWAWWGVARSLMRKPTSLIAVSAIVYGAVIAITPHKEERFLYPACVLGVVAAAPVWTAWCFQFQRREYRSAAAGLGFLLGAASLWTYPADLRGDQFRALVQATRGNAKGLLIVNEGLWGAGGYFYIGKNIPWLTCDEAHEARFQQAMADPRINRAITFEGRALEALQARGFRITGTVGRETMLER